MANPVVQVENVSRVFTAGDVEVRALENVSLTIERGEFVAIIGASGSGKSTLMAILGCLDHPSGGRVLLDGVDVATLQEPELAQIRSESLGFVFQSFNLLARTSALENVSLPLVYSETSVHDGQTRAMRAREALKLLGLSERERNTPAQLSGGQQQRVAIARALINDPKLVLADEPTGNLDTRTSHEIMDTLVHLNRERGVTIVLVTHEPDIANYASRVVTMRDGHIVSDERRTDRPAPVVIEARPGPVAVPRHRSMAALARMILGAAVESVMRNAMRSILTMLGVFVGVAALIAMVAIGEGANEAVRKQIESLGTNVIVVLPGAIMTGGMRGGFGSASTLTVEDAKAIRSEDPAVTLVAWLARQAGQVQFANQNWTTNIQGVSPNYPAITNWRIESGRSMTPDDDLGGALVAVIGQTVRRQLFGPGQNPVGATLLVKGTPLLVIGTFAAKGQTPFGQDQDDVVMIPFSTAERRVLGVAAPSQQQSQLKVLYPVAPNPLGLQPRITGYVNQIFVQAATADQVGIAISQISALLDARHHTKRGEPRDFDIRNLSQIAETAEGSGRVFALLLAAVASISLVVGGIGIMNILLVSVTERTREIGLRMAIGARRLHVLLQFLAEAVVMSVVGGLAGIAFGIAATKVIGLITGWNTPISLTAVAVGFVFSAAVGMFFGFYPARKAAHFDPIEALRYE